MLGELLSGRSHPTPEQAFAALEEARCLYSPISSCSGPAAAVGLRNELDDKNVLVCKAHYGRLRKLEGPALEGLEQFLVTAYADKRRRQRELEEPPAEPAGPRLVVR